MSVVLFVAEVLDPQADDGISGCLTDALLTVAKVNLTADVEVAAWHVIDLVALGVFAFRFLAGALFVHYLTP